MYRFLLDSRFPPATPERSNGGQVAGMTELFRIVMLVFFRTFAKVK
jgi:hypothetical protein